MYLISKGLGSPLHTGGKNTTILCFGLGTDLQIQPSDQVDDELAFVHKAQEMTPFVQSEYTEIMEIDVLKDGFRQDSPVEFIAAELARIANNATTMTDGSMSADDKNTISTLTALSQLLTANGQANTFTSTTLLTSTDPGQIITLDNGDFIGERKNLLASSGYGTGNSSIVIPVSFLDGTSITLSSQYDSVILEWNGTGWKIITLFESASVN